MTDAPRFHLLTIVRISPEAGGSISVVFAISPEQVKAYTFTPGQYLTLRAHIDGQDIRRSYSICSTPTDLFDLGQITIGIRSIEGGVFSNWAMSQLKPGDQLQVMTPQGRFVSTQPRALHRVGFAVGSGITPILSIMSTMLAQQPASKFTLVYGNRSMATVMFNETLQDLKDLYMDRLTLVHVLSRQPQEADLLHGRIDASKIHALIDKLLPVESMDEVFICGPETMIEVVTLTLSQAGVPDSQIHSERFTSARTDDHLSTVRPIKESRLQNAEKSEHEVSLSITLDGKLHELNMSKNQNVLDAALLAGLDLPYSCKGGVCSTCRVKVIEGSVRMDKNFGLEKWETDKGFVLSCQAVPLTDRVTVSFDER